MAAQLDAAFPSYGLTFSILCVDDEELSLRAMARALSLLTDLTLEVDTASSAAEARALLDQDAYAVLITDHRMPEVTGVELLEEVAAQELVPVSVLVTGQTDMETALAAVNRGHVYGLLHKPWRHEELALLVRHAIERFELSSSLSIKIGELERTNRSLGHANQMLAASHKEMKRLHEMAATDEKTGLKSYRFFSDRLEEEVARALRYRHCLSLALLDLDGFKAVNDRHGHVAGDGVLRSIAQMLTECMRMMDVLARFGGDEFALILPDTDLDGALVLGERLREQVREHDFEPARAGEVTLSMGIACIPVHGVRTAPALLELADKALYGAKAGGRDCCAVAPIPDATVG